MYIFNIKITLNEYLHTDKTIALLFILRRREIEGKCRLWDCIIKEQKNNLGS